MIKLRVVFTNLLQLPLSPIMLLEIIISIFIFVVSLIFFMSVIFSNPRPTIQSSAWRIHNNSEIGDYSSQRINSDNDALMRPLFNKNRRPSLIDKTDPNISEENLKVSGTPTNINLFAIAKFGNEDRAYVSSPTSPNGAWYKTGDNVEDWIIKKINSTNVVIKKADIDGILLLYNNLGSATFTNSKTILPLGQPIPQNLGAKNPK